MSYHLGVDLGTTFTAAAIHRGDVVEMVPLGVQALSVPSVIFVDTTGEVLVGDPAIRRAHTDPGRVARQIKRRFGDVTPLLLGGTPYSAEVLVGRILEWVLETVTAREGAAPDSVALTHPANWGGYKLELLEQTVRTAGLPDALFVSEPEAAALHWASQERVDEGILVAAYDLGGGTFDAAVLRKEAEGFTVVGRPEGIERLGGIDFDDAIFAHVTQSLDLSELDTEDPGVRAALVRLRTECIEAKHALSFDTDVSVPVLLPNLATEVRITRGEFETLIRPRIDDSVAALSRAVAGAGLERQDIDRVLLVGGSSGIPLVAQMVSEATGRPIAVDAHPKHAVALGAALTAAQHAGVGLPVVAAAPAQSEETASVGETAAEDPAPDDSAGPEVTAPAAPAALAATVATSVQTAADHPARSAPEAPRSNAKRSKLASVLPILLGATVLAGSAWFLLPGLGGGDDGTKATADTPARTPTVVPTRLQNPTRVVQSHSALTHSPAPTSKTLSGEDAFLQSTTGDKLPDTECPDQEGFLSGFTSYSQDCRQVSWSEGLARGVYIATDGDAGSGAVGIGTASSGADWNLQFYVENDPTAGDTKAWTSARVATATFGRDEPSLVVVYRYPDDSIAVDIVDDQDGEVAVRAHLDPVAHGIAVVDDDDNLAIYTKSGDSAARAVVTYDAKSGSYRATKTSVPVSHVPHDGA
jgi:molecular chaperone DnaK